MSEYIAHFFSQPPLVAVLISSVTALIIAVFGEMMRKWWIKPKLHILKTVEMHEQSVDRMDGITASTDYWLSVYRIMIENKGNISARDVEVDVVSIYDDINIKRNNFLPCPLVWTHAQEYSKSRIIRDIHSNQVAYLDFISLYIPSFSSHSEYHCKVNRKLFLNIGPGRDSSELSGLKKGKTMLKLKIYQESGHAISCDCSVHWDGQSDVAIEFID